MNILVTTPMYLIKDRPELVQDTAAIHYLLKYLTGDNDVRVIYTYPQSPRHLLRYLKKKQFQYMRDGYYYEADGVKVAMCDVTLKKKQSWVFEGIQAKWIANFMRDYLLRESFAPDVVIAHVPTAMVNVWGHLDLQVPKFAVFHESDIKFAEIDPSLVGKLKGEYDHFFARSNPIRNYFEKSLEVDKKIIYSGVNVPELQCKRTEKQCGKSATVLYVGKLCERKRLDYLIRAISKLEPKYDIHLEIYGDGKCRKRFEKLAEELLDASDYTFHGDRPRDEVFTAMSLADIFCMASVDETLGLVYLEAMACGCITIGSRGEGIDGIIVDGENGFLVDPDDVDDIAAKISSIIEMTPEERYDIRKRTKETMQSYTEESASKNYLKRVEENLHD